MLCAFIFANASDTLAQFTFNGDYDKTFAAPNGYYVDGQFPTSNQEVTTYNVGGIVNPDGSVVWGGRIAGNASGGADFYLRKFTATGAIDTLFGTNGFVRTIFSTQFDGNVVGDSNPIVIKRQSDGKIVMGGICNQLRSATDSANNGGPGTDFCLVRYNANGLIDQSFGGYTFLYGSPGSMFTNTLAPGRVWIKSGIDENGSLFGSSSQLRDMVIQPDGKIIVVGETISRVNPYSQGVGNARYEGVVVRFNTNGTLDTSFGNNNTGIARFIDNTCTASGTAYYPFRGFYGVRLQADGRIIAVGYDGNFDAGCGRGRVFVVTRWNSNGTLETARRLDSSTDPFANERATTALITNDGTKLLVGGYYQQRATLVRLNLSDLTLDTAFGTNGVIKYNNAQFSPLNIKAIQPDGKILAIQSDNFGVIARLNPNGSPDNSFGNRPFDSANTLGRARLTVSWFRGNTPELGAADLALYPNSRFVTFGSISDGQATRSYTSRHNNSCRSGIYSDFTNDGKSEISVFRASSGVWHQLNSSNNAYSAFSWGISGDKIAPADFDGDGKTDAAVFRNGIWYIFQSTNNQVRTVNFGLANDLPRPGDFDGDGYADIAVFRPSIGVWYWINSSNNQVSTVQFGQNGDAPVIGDFDGDGKSDVSIFRNGVWYFIRSSNGSISIVQFGAAGDVPVVGDYDGDGKSDLAVFRNGVWYALRSSDGGATIFSWGQTGDKPVPADYDNDGKNDFAIYRNGVWWIYFTGNNSFTAVSFGLATDTPLQSAYLP